MATVTDVEVANASFPNVRQDLNDILEALATNFSADAEPTTTYPNQFWYETDSNLLYIRNEADDAWITLASINQTSGEWEPRTAVIQAVDSAGLALKTDEGTTRFSISDAGVVSFENYAFPSADGTNGQVLTTDGSGTLTFEDGGAGDKIEEGNSSVEVVDTGTGYITNVVDGTERLRVDTSGIDVNGTVTAQGLNFDIADGVEINALESLLIDIDSDNNDVGRVFQIRTNNTTTLLVVQDGGDLKFNSGFGSVAIAYGVRAWVNFDGTGTPSIRDDGNVSSISDNGTGTYTVNMSTAMPDVNYAASGSNIGDTTSTNRFSCDVCGGNNANTTTQFQVVFLNSGTQTDPTHGNIQVIR